MTSSRRIAAQYRRNKPCRTKSSKARIYIAVPPESGWPAFTGSNWAALGLRSKKG